MWIKKLKTSQFRNLKAVDLTLPSAGVYVLYGHNGAGKTNVLEVISLLSPGQGLHRDTLENMLPEPADGKKAKQWGFYSEICRTQQGNDEVYTIGVGYNKKKRTIKINGDEAANQAELASLGAVLWFTPEMDRLFFASPAARRRFFDRLVFGLYPHHASHLSRHTKHQQSRAQLLKDTAADPDWVALEEQQMAHYAVAVVQARLKYLEQLKGFIENVDLHLSGNAEKLYTEILADHGTEHGEDQGADHLEAAFTHQFAQNRHRDGRFKTTHFGPHRTDVSGALLLENGEAVPLERTSMGQHKKALLHILIGAAKLQHSQTGHPPCILLDEVATHLDEHARTLLYGQLLPLGGQLWLTGTEKAQFSGLKGARFIAVDGGIATAEFTE